VDPNFATIGLFGAVLAPSRYTDPVMKEPRRKIDAELEAKIALEALREQATVADLAMKWRGPQPAEITAKERTLRGFSGAAQSQGLLLTPFETTRFSAAPIA
jgi:hypothetical protein